MENVIALKEEREKIFSLFVLNRKMRFSEIESAIGLRSNLVNYHLQKLIEDKVIEKTGDGEYKLSIEGEKMIPFFAQITGKEQGPLSVVVVAVLRDGKICLLKRKKRPYQGYWGLIGGKLKLKESIKETALRETEEETGLKCSFDRICSVIHERVSDGGEVKHGFIVFLCRVKAKKGQEIESEEGEVDWFEFSKLPKEIIPSDKIMIEKLLEGEFSGKEVLIKEKEGVLGKMEVSEIGEM